VGSRLLAVEIALGIRRGNKNQRDFSPLSEWRVCAGGCSAANPIPFFLEPNQVVECRDQESCHGKKFSAATCMAESLGCLSTPNTKNFTRSHHVFTGLVAYREGPFCKATLGGRAGVPNKLMRERLVSAKLIRCSGEEAGLWGARIVDADCSRGTGLASRRGVCFKGRRSVEAKPSGFAPILSIVGRGKRVFR